MARKEFFLSSYPANNSWKHHSEEVSFSEPTDVIMRFWEEEGIMERH